ncbi:MAG: bifunctional oligoribonuclease/PAP phosphatase NrnA [Niameybacter sp.]|uniref:DHH family phosphoesterase n=1 Tax=Niameybacter sp. TaxID=2033640 RepID=UPI002FCC61D3
MNKTLIEEIINKIEAYDTIALYRHVYPDPDSYGAQVALKNMIEESFPGKKVYLMGKHNPDLAYIGVMDDPSQVNINKDCLAILLDIGDAHRVDDQSYSECGYVIKIDHHHSFGEEFANLAWVDINYPATSLMLLDLFLECDKRLQINKVAREALYIGIVADTGRFVYLENPTNVFKKMEHLTYDLNTKPLYAAFYKRKMNAVKFMGYIYSNFEVRENGVAVLKIPKEIIEQYEMDYMVAARMVNTLQDIEGVINWHFFAEVPTTGKIMCEFRSIGPRVNEIAAKYGGGGHFLAGGATIDSWDTVESIIQDFEANCGAYLADYKESK